MLGGVKNYFFRFYLEMSRPIAYSVLTIRRICKEVEEKVDKLRLLQVLDEKLQLQEKGTP